MTAAPASERELEELRQTWAQPPGLAGWFAAVQNNSIGLRYILTAFGFFLVAGVNALVMRAQLAAPELKVVSPETYNQLMTLHGSTMMFLFAVPILEAFATYMIPFTIGARDLPMPRLTAMGYWVYLFGGVMFQLSFFIGAAPDGGWFAYVPLTGPSYSPNVNMDFWLLGLGVIEVSGIAAAIELIVGICMSRAPGMSLNRMPVFAWAILIMAFMILFAFPSVIAGSLLLELDRALHTQWFNPALGGDPLLWQHLFWIFGHPEVYIMFIPAAGVVSMVIPTFTRRPLAGYTWVVTAIVSIGFLSFGLWVHHMFTTGIPLLPLTFFSAASLMIAIAGGVQVFAWIATIWHGRIVWKTPFLFVIGFLVNFVLGGITGVMVAVAPFDWQVHDSYFVVAHFHYVLIGGVVFPVFAGLYYWLPKMTGHMLAERAGQISFWLTFIGFNVTFFPMHIVGLLGMPRRVYTYQAGLGWDLPNLISTVGAFVLAAGVLVSAGNFLWSLRRGREAGGNPWDASTLEWSVSSPPPDENFTRIPIVRGRDPLWGRDEDGESGIDDDLARRLVADQLSAHDGVRETFTTTMLDAQPTAIIQVAGDSYRPLLAAFGLAVAFVGGIIPHVPAKLFAIGVGYVIAMGAILAWLWPDRDARAAWQVHERGDLHPLPTEVSGTKAPSWWGTVLLCVALGATFTYMLFGYFFLLSNNPDTWPPPGTKLPGWELAATGTVVLLASLGSVLWAERGIRAGNIGWLKLGIAAATVLGLAFLGIQAAEYARLDFGHSAHAFGSAFYTLMWFQTGLMVVALMMSVVVLIRAFLGHFTARRVLAVQNTAVYWSFTVTVWLLTFATLYGAPHVF